MVTSAIHLVLQNGPSILNLFLLSPLVTWVVLAGGVYGAFRLVFDVVLVIVRYRRSAKLPPPPPARPAYPPPPPPPKP